MCCSSVALEESLEFWIFTQRPYCQTWWCAKLLYLEVTVLCNPWCPNRNLVSWPNFNIKPPNTINAWPLNTINTMQKTSNLQFRNLFLWYLMTCRNFVSSTYGFTLTMCAWIRAEILLFFNPSHNDLTVKLVGVPRSCRLKMMLFCSSSCQKEVLSAELNSTLNHQTLSWYVEIFSCFSVTLDNMHESCIFNRRPRCHTWCCS